MNHTNLLLYGIAISLWTVLLITTGYMARDYATRDVQHIEQLELIGE